MIRCLLNGEILVERERGRLLLVEPRRIVRCVLNGVDFNGEADIIRLVSLGRSLWERENQIISSWGELLSLVGGVQCGRHIILSRVGEMIWCIERLWGEVRCDIISRVHGTYV